jgi:shikimate kinase
MSADPDLLHLLPEAGPTVLLAVAVLALWKRDEKRDKERLEIGTRRDERISALESKQDQHATQYRELAERVADVVGQTKHVMERVLEKLG